MAADRIVTFTTDFGITDHYVGAMKGVLLNINPAARIVDISNSVQSYDVLDGASDEYAIATSVVHGDAMPEAGASDPWQVLCAEREVRPRERPGALRS